MDRKSANRPPLSMIEVVRYTAQHAEAWDKFVRSEAKNGLFLCERKFVEYHAHRFTDHSLLFYQKERLVAVLPANERKTQFCSHEGLSFAGLLVHRNFGQALAAACFDALITYLQAARFKEFIYKQTPAYFHQQLAAEDHYCLHRLGAELIGVEPSAVLDLQKPPHVAYHPLRKRQLAKAKRAHLRVEQHQDFAAFWAILTQNLAERHQKTPAHSLAEMQYLHSCFPEKIILYSVYDTADNQLAGAVVYCTPVCVHTQYIASTPEGRRLGAVDALIDALAEKYRSQVPYLSLGVSVERRLQTINAGLQRWKEGFGCVAYPHFVYRLDLQSTALPHYFSARTDIF